MMSTEELAPLQRQDGLLPLDASGQDHQIPPHPGPLPLGGGEGESSVHEGGSGGGDKKRPLLSVFRQQSVWKIVGVVVLAGISATVWWGASARAKVHSATTPVVEPLPVSVARVTRHDLYNEASFPAEFRPFVEVDLHAKVSGYVRDIRVDFGDQVKSNQLLATLEVPELFSELTNAIATEQKAEADYTNAHLLYDRLGKVNSKVHPALVPQQEIDTAEAKDRATLAAIAAAKANVEKYQSLVGYTRITAPFDGVITKRYADPGSLIQAGTASDTQSLPLVRVSDNYLLRLDFPVDQRYVKDVYAGEPVEVRIESLGGIISTGIITRATLRENADTRTMMTEIEVPNPKLQIVPGMYCRVLLKVERRPQALAVPIQAVPPGYGDTVYVVNAQNQIEERTVTLGLMTSTEFEVTSGLKEGEQVLLGSRSQLEVGQKVEPKLDASDKPI